MDAAFKRPALTVDVVVIAGRQGAESVLLIRRGREPFVGSWALPGGFVDEGELLEDAALRELAEETGLQLPQGLAQLGTWGDPGRDPRGWTVSVVWIARLGESLPDVLGGDDAAEAAWHPVSRLPEMAFDHAAILEAARERLGLD